MHDRTLRLLIAADHADDVKPLLKAFKKEPAWEIAVVEDSQEALDFLFRRRSYSDAWRPDLLILDTNMPKVDGPDVLEKVKNTPYLAKIPVVMWTISEAASEIRRAYELGAAAFITEPVNKHKMEKYAFAIRTFWDKAQFMHDT